jgi:hypothetical protein
MPMGSKCKIEDLQRLTNGNCAWIMRADEMGVDMTEDTLGRQLDEALSLIKKADVQTTDFIDNIPAADYESIMEKVDLVTDLLESAQHILLEAEVDGLPELEEPDEDQETEPEEPEVDEETREKLVIMERKQELEHRSRLIEARILRGAADKVGPPLTKPGKPTEHQDELLNAAATALEAGLGSMPDPETLLVLADLRILQLEIKKAREVCDIALKVAPGSEYAERAEALIERMNTDPILKDRGRCFIATAACGSLESPEVRILREFRDEVLEKSTLGTALVRFYYSFSPPIARALDRSAVCRRLVRDYFIRPVAQRVIKWKGERPW